MAGEEEREEHNEDLAVNQTADDIAQIAALAQQFPELAEDEEVKGLMEIVDKNTSTDEEGGEEQEELDFGDEQEEEEEEQEEGDEQEEEEEEDEEEDEEEEEEDEDDPWGLGKSKKSVEVDFELGEDAMKYLKSKYSIDDPNKFFSSVDKWRNDAQKQSETESQHSELLEGLQSLPDNIKASIEAYANGRDYIEAFGAKKGIDFSKDFGTQDEDEIVEYYYPEKYKKIMKKLNDGDLSDEEVDERVKDLYDIARSLYDRDKQSVEDRRAEMVRDQQDRGKRVKASATSSVDSLREEFPNFKSGDLQRIKKILVDGSVDSYLYNKDGSVKEEAAKRMAFFFFGDKILDKEKKVSKNKGKSEANLETVRRGKKKLKSNKSTSGAQQSSKAEESVSHLNTHFKSDPYAESID